MEPIKQEPVKVDLVPKAEPNPKQETKEIKTKHDLVDANIASNNPQKRKKLATRLVVCLLLLLVVLVSVARVPYAGSYVDGLFDYILGQAKYAFYLLAIFVLCAIIYNGRIAKIIKTPKFIIFSLLGLLAIGCIISGASDLVKFFKQHPTFVERMNDYHSSWKDYFFTTNYSGYFNHFISGGILAVMLSFLFNFVSYAILIIFAAVLLVICILIIFNINYKSTRVGLKLRGWLIKKLGGTFKYDGFDELKSNESNQNKFKKTTKAEIEKAVEADKLSFNLLPATDINNDKANWKKAASVQTKIANLLKTYEINCVPSDINVFTSFSEVCFETKSESQIKKIIKLQKEISSVAKLDKFNLSYRGNVLSIEFDNLHFSKLSLRSASHLIQPKPLLTFFGIDKNKKIAFQDFKNSPSALIVGKKGSGSATLAVLMTLCMCYDTKPDNLDLVILNINCEQTYNAFTSLPHTSGKIYDTVSDVTNKLHDLQNVINQRSSLLKINNVDNIDQYNKLTNDSTSQMKHILVVMPNVENIIKDTFQNAKIVEDLITLGPKVGLYVILQTYHVCPEILEEGLFANVSDKYVFAIETPEQSRKLLGSSRANVLHPDGDCLHFAGPKIQSLHRIQTCNINKAELASAIDIIKTFYAIKKEINQNTLLGDNNGKKK